MMEKEDIVIPGLRPGQQPSHPPGKALSSPGDLSPQSQQVNPRGDLKGFAVQHRNPGSPAKVMKVLYPLIVFVVSRNSMDAIPDLDGPEEGDEFLHLGKAVLHQVAGNYHQVGFQAI